MARTTLEKLKEDDSRTVSLAAIKQLSALEKSPEEENLALQQAAQDKAEQEAVEQARKEREASEEAALEKAKHEAAEKAKREKMERRAALMAALRERSSKSFITIKSALLKTRPFFGIAGIVAVIAVLAWISSWAIPWIFSSSQIPGTTTLPPPSQLAETSTPPKTATPTEWPLTPKTATPASVQTLTETPAVRTETATQFSLPLIGGADKIAFVANNEIWLMNVNGSDREQLTSDGDPKSDLQFLSREILLFISGSDIKYVNISTGVVDILTKFPSDSWLNAFRVSDDGKQAMISLKNEMFIIPFDFEQIKSVHTRKDLLQLDRCPDRTTLSEFAVKEALWSADNQFAAWLLKGIQGQQVSIVDSTTCNAENPVSTFPRPYISLGKEVTNIDWDGRNQFVFNTNDRYSGWEETGSWIKGWGKLYVYDWNQHKRYPIELSKEQASCCFRDARWSPDGKYLFFAFQEYAVDAPIRFYYMPYNDGKVTEMDSLSMEGVTFKNPKDEAPQAALRPAP